MFALFGAWDAATVAVVCATILFLLGAIRNISWKKESGLYVSGRYYVTDISAVIKLHELSNIDRDCRDAIFDGSTTLVLVSDKRFGENKTRTDFIVQSSVNHVARIALYSSSVSNHHTVDIARLGIEGYIAQKVKKVMDYLAMEAVFASHAKVSTEDVHKFICAWIKLIVCPNVIESCDRKIELYEALYNWENLSIEFKRHISNWKQKNIGYKAIFQQLANESDILVRSSVLIQSNRHLSATKIQDDP